MHATPPSDIAVRTMTARFIGSMRGTDHPCRERRGHNRRRAATGTRSRHRTRRAVRRRCDSATNSRIHGVLRSRSWAHFRLASHMTASITNVATVSMVTAGLQITPPSLMMRTQAGRAITPAPAPSPSRSAPWSIPRPPPPPLAVTRAAGITVIPSCSLGSPNTVTVDMSRWSRSTIGSNAG